MLATYIGKFRYYYSYTLEKSVLITTFLINEIKKKKAVIYFFF